MPYRYANYFAGFVLLTIIVGFWGSYFTPSFGLSMVFAIVAYLVLFYLALRNRRSVRLHAGYMLATPLVLFESPFSRIMLDHLPFLVFTGAGFPQRILDAIVISMAMAIAFALGALVCWLGFKAPSGRSPGPAVMPAAP